MRQYILTERAHLMCPNMHFGIKVKIAARYDERKLQDALQALAAAHPFLKSNIAQEAESGKQPVPAADPRRSSIPFAHPHKI